MKPLVHPPVEHLTVEGILHALADPVRVSIYMQLAKADCAKICSEFIGVGEQTIPKSTLSQHFKTLRDAGLIRSERRGVEMLSLTRCGEIEKRFPGLLPSILQAYTTQNRRKPRSI